MIWLSARPSAKILCPKDVPPPNSPCSPSPALERCGYDKFCKTFAGSGTCLHAATWAECVVGVGGSPWLLSRHPREGTWRISEEGLRNERKPSRRARRPSRSPSSSTSTSSSPSTSRSHEVVTTLNARYRAGRPSNDPASAGVVLHALNAQLGKALNSPWLSSIRSQRVSCVIANARLPFIYHGALHDQRCSYQTPGFVINTAAVKRAFLCAYSNDGGTNGPGKSCPANWRAAAVAYPNKCRPGCPSETNPSRQHHLARLNLSVVGLDLSRAMLGHESRVAEMASKLSHRDLSLAASLDRARLAMQGHRNQYNEVVLAADMLNSLLPGAIEAVYMLPHTTITDAVVAFAKQAHKKRNVTVGAPHSADNDTRLARSVHSRLLLHFNLTAQQLPLLELNMSDRVAPFRLAPPLQSAAQGTSMP